MNPLRLLLITVILVAAGGFGFVAYTASLPPPPPKIAAAPPPPPVKMATILVAARPLPAGTLLKDEDMVGKTMAEAEVPENAVTLDDESKTAFRGAMLRSYVEAGLPIQRGDVLRPRERGFLAAVLRPGLRAISVGVDVISGASGLIWPGDQVDVILVQDLDSGKSGVDRRVVGETILSDIRVIAVDQQFTQGAPAGNADGRVARTVALEVTAADAEKVAVAGGLGRIELSVRAIDAGAADIRRPPLFGSDVSKAFARPVAAPTRTMRLIQGAETQEVTFR